MEITFELYMSKTHAAHAEYFTVEPLPSFVRREFQLKVILERVTRFYLSRHWFRLRFQQQRCYSPARLLSSVTEPRLVGVATGPGYAVVPTACACAVLRLSSRDDCVPRAGRDRFQFCNHN